MLYRVEGIVIRSADYGEGNKIVTLYTREVGKVTVMARGAKKLNSRHGAAVQLFTLGEYVFFKSGQMGTLNNAEIESSNQLLREDLKLAAYSSYIAELTDKTIGDGEPDIFLYEQLKAALGAMAEGKDAEIVLHMYEFKILQIAGYMPALDDCVSCGEPSADAAFSVALGGVLCRRCAYKDSKGFELSPGMLKLLRTLASADIRRLGQIGLKDETKTRIRRMVRAYFDHHAGMNLKSRHFLDQMEKYGI